MSPWVISRRPPCAYEVNLLPRSLASDSEASKREKYFLPIRTVSFHMSRFILNESHSYKNCYLWVSSRELKFSSLGLQCNKTFLLFGIFFGCLGIAIARINPVNHDTAVMQFFSYFSTAEEHSSILTDKRIFCMCVRTRAHTHTMLYEN